MREMLRENGHAPTPSRVGTGLSRHNVANGKDPLMSSAVAQRLEASRNRPPDPRMKAFVEPHMGHNFAQMRVHHDASSVTSIHVSNAPSSFKLLLQRNAFETPHRLQGRCGTLTGLKTDLILEHLGNGDPLPTTIRREMEPAFNATFRDVRIHADSRAAELNNRLATKAFTVGRHIAFSRDSYRPISDSGKELLGHELAHATQAVNFPRHVFAWQTEAAGHTYPRHHEGGFTHEDLTERLVQVINLHQIVYGERARRIIRYWVAEIDRAKGHPEQILRSFPEIAQYYDRIAESRRRRNAEVYSVESLLHSYGGVPAEDIGVHFPGTETSNTGSLTGGGIIGELLRQAARNFNDGQLEHALRLLGISLHTIQDFYSHHTPLAERDAAIRRGEEFSVLEDDPSLGPWRWQAAKGRTREALDLFYQQLSAGSRTVLASSNLTTQRAPMDAGTFGVHGVPWR